MSFKNFLQDSGDFLANNARFSADMLLSTVGADNVINEDSYTGKSKEGFSKASKIGGSIYKGIAPIAAGAAGMVIGGPMGAQIGMQGMKSIQGVGNSLNPQDNRGGTDGYLNAQKNANNMQQPLQNLGNTGIGVMSMLPMFNKNSGNMSGMGNMDMEMSRGMEDTGRATVGYRNGGYNMYDDGGMQPNAEVEKQENSVAPNGNFTQYNGPSHEQGGIPTQLQPGEMVFSDKLKLGNKTFADLNKSNNTSKEDKILEDKKSNNISKATAEIMKSAKLKNSQTLFSTQEQLKQDKVQSYAKRMGVNLPQFQQPSQDNEQTKPQGQSEQFEGEIPVARNGGIMKYLNGGLKGDPRKVDKIPENYIKGDMINGKQTYYNQNNNPGNLQPAPGGKQDPNPNHYFETMKTKVSSGTDPKELFDNGYIDEGGLKKLQPFYKKDVVFTESPLQSPKEAEFTPAKGLRTKIELLPNKSANQPWQTYRINNLDGQANKSIDKHFTPDGREVDLEKYIKTGDLSKSLHDSGLTVNDYRISNVKSDGTGETMPLHKINGVNVTKVNDTNVVQPNGSDQINNRAFRNGGIYPKYLEGGYGPEENKPENMQMKNWALGTSPMLEDIRQPTTTGINMDNINNYLPNDQYGVNKNYSNQGNNPNNNNKMLTQLALGLSQNAGNLYDLKNAKHPEVEKYQRMTPSLLSSSAEEQYNNNQGKLAVEDLRNASVGNSSTYIQNRKDLALNQMLTNSRIRQSNDNINSQINNRAGEFNTNIDMQEKNANAMNRARAQDLTSNAYRNMGSNINSQYKDVQMGNRDNDMLKMIAMKNPQAANDPALLALFKKYGITY